MRRAARLAAPAAAAAAFALAGCVQTAELEPAPEALRVDSGAAAEVEGVELVARPDAWRDEDIRQHVTPLHVTIHNDSGRPLQVRYEAFALLSESGARYAALPPFDVEGETSRRVATPRLRHHFFHVAPYHAHYYPRLTVTHLPFAHHAFSYGHYYDDWERVPLPTDAMLERAIPEGVVQPGGSLSGFLYFERVDPEIERVTFRADLTNASSGRTFGSLHIPFRVDGD